MELQRHVGDVRNSGMGLVAISYDPVATLADFSSRRGITFPLLSDPGSVTIKRYGILNTTVDPKNQLYGYPFPGTFVVDRSGRVTSRFFEEDYVERDTISSVLVRLGRRLTVPATKVAGAHVTITSYASDQTAAPGTHFSLVVDVAPAARVHVYAPGASGYKPVKLTLRPQAGLVLRAARFPKPEDYFFKPLNEHVPVYQHPFRIVQDVMLDPSRAARNVLQAVTSLSIEGRFEYQACDDQVCFVPQTIPLSWTIGIAALDRGRPEDP